MMWLRRAAGELLTGAQRQAAVGTRPLPTAAAAAAAGTRWLQQAGVHGDSGQEDFLRQEPQAFSAAMKQLEAAVSENLLPADALQANKKALATLKEFSTSLSSSPSGYPPAAVKNVEFVFRWGCFSVRCRRP